MTRMRVIHSTVTLIGFSRASTQGNTQVNRAKTTATTRSSIRMMRSHTGPGSTRQRAPYISALPSRDDRGDLGRRAGRARLPRLEHAVGDDALGGRVQRVAARERHDAIGGLQFGVVRHGGQYL